MQTTTIMSAMKRHPKQSLIPIISKLASAIGEYTLTEDAMLQVNALTHLMCETIFQKATHILDASRRKTLTEDEVLHAVNLVFGDSALSERCVSASKSALHSFETHVDREESKGLSRHSKADLTIPPCVIEKYFPQTSTHMSVHVPIVVAAVVEVVLGDLLLKATRHANESLIISVEHLMKATQHDTWYTRHHISFHCTNNNTVFPRSVMENRLKRLLSEQYPDLRYQRDCFALIQESVEDWLMQLLKDTNTVTQMSKKSRVTAEDIDVVLSLMHKSFLKDDKT